MWTSNWSLSRLKCSSLSPLAGILRLSPLKISPPAWTQSCSTRLAKRKQAVSNLNHPHKEQTLKSSVVKLASKSSICPFSSASFRTSNSPSTSNFSTLSFSNHRQLLSQYTCTHKLHPTVKQQIRMLWNDFSFEWRLLRRVVPYSLRSSRSCCSWLTFPTLSLKEESRWWKPLDWSKFTIAVMSNQSEVNVFYYDFEYSNYLSRESLHLEALKSSINSHLTDTFFPFAPSNQEPLHTPVSNTKIPSGIQQRQFNEFYVINPHTRPSLPPQIPLILIEQR